MANITLDTGLTPARPSSISDYAFNADRLRIWAKEITNEPTRADRVYAEIAARLKTEAEAEQQSQEQVDGLAESTPDDLTEYPEREA